MDAVRSARILKTKICVFYNMKNCAYNAFDNDHARTRYNVRQCNSTESGENSRGEKT